MKNYKTEIYLFVSFLVIVSLIIFINWRRKKMKIGDKEYTFKNSNTAGHIEQLHPIARPYFAAFVEELESPANGDLVVTFTSSYRSPEKQKAMFVAKETPTEISLHNFGFATDMNINGKDKQGNIVALRMKSPSADKDSKEFNDWAKVVKIAKKHNLNWGGTFTGYADRVHFQYAFAKSAKVYLTAFKSGSIDKNGFVIA